MDWSVALAVAGTAASVTGLVVSAVQTVRYRAARAMLDQARRSRNANIWHSISLILQAYDSIDDARALAAQSAAAEAPLLLAKINSTRRSIINQYLQQLKEAILDEEIFTEETVREWQRLGKLENEWRVAQALKFVRLRKTQLTNIVTKETEPTTEENTPRT